MPVAIRTRDNLFKLNLITAQMRSYLYFDGNSYVQFAPVVMSGTRTISFYVYFDDVSSTTSHYMYGNTEGYASRFVISYSGRFNIRANQSDNNSNFTEKSVFTSGIIHYVEVTITDTTCSVKVNGIEEYSETIPTADTYINLFGSNGTSVYGSFYLYDVSLNGERVYKLNEGAGIIVADSLNPDGDELVINGTFDENVEEWSDGGINAVVSWDDGRLQLTQSATYTSSIQLVSVEAGKSYLFSGEVNRGDIFAYLQVRSLAGDILLEIREDGLNTGVFTAVDSAVTIRLHGGNALGSAWFDNISIKETTSGQINNYQDSLWNQGLPS
ncbi:hypothetical protein CSW98_01500 [Vibrio sp. HA2012]|uniref:LamG-like jellyroll fold domain-containing protein n=1 Tax=Vibrio sp. HA2012 TaxID=1971595 RepID=UPI000C2BD304|nr:LamG-like jellyroll fold domain-containing protein [Vibrio sp. HA2012]PJC87827.1 hypothetical protein CSW98_01500 [Vibrio sp. HA2012]